MIMIRVSLQNNAAETDRHSRQFQLKCIRSKFVPDVMTKATISVTVHATIDLKLRVYFMLGDETGLRNQNTEQCF